MTKNSVLLGSDCITSGDVPLIVVQEPTVLGADEAAIHMDTLPPFDQVSSPPLSLSCSLRKD